MTTPIKEIREALDDFYCAMIAKLVVNNEKEHWSTCSQEELFMDLRKNVGALDMAVQHGADATTILGKAANVANFAMMIAANYHQEPT